MQENAYLMNNAIKRLDNGLFVMVNDTHLSKWVEEEGRLDHARHFLERVRQPLQCSVHFVAIKPGFGCNLAE